MSKTFVDATEVARILELDSAAAFLRQRYHLEDDHEFPFPVPWSKRPLKWRRSSVEFWADQQGHKAPDDQTPQDLAPHVATGKVALLREAATP